MGSGCTMLWRGLRIGLFDKLIFEQNVNWNERASHADNWEETFRAEGTMMIKTLCQECLWFWGQQWGLRVWNRMREGKSAKSDKFKSY